MIAAYTFLTMFAAQVLALSVLAPALLLRRLRIQLARYPAEQFPQFYPQGAATGERPLSIYRTLNGLVAMTGLGLLAWFYTYTQQPDWNDGPIEALAAVYMAMQVVPLMLLGASAAQASKRLRNRFPEGKRKATLQRRGLFDFVSPPMVSLAIVGYALYVAYVLYLAQHPFPGFAGPAVNIGMITAFYGAMALVVYATLYGRKKHPLQSQASRLRTIEITVKACVFTCIGVVVFSSLNFTFVLLDLQRWEPVGQCVFNLLIALRLISRINTPADDLDLDALHLERHAIKGEAT